MIIIIIPEHKKSASATATRRSNLLTKLKDLDLIGFSIFAPACVMFLLAIQWGGVRYSWQSATIVGLFIGSGLAVIIFFFWERHVGEDAMVPLDILSRRAVLFSSATSLFQMGGQMIVSYYLPIWFQVVQGVSPTLSGVRTLPVMVAQMIAAIVSGALGTRKYVSVSDKDC